MEMLEKSGDFWRLSSKGGSIADKPGKVTRLYSHPLITGMISVTFGDNFISLVLYFCCRPALQIWRGRQQSHIT
jgi:hypothetical protein